MSPFEKGHPNYNKPKEKDSVEIPENFKTDAQKEADAEIRSTQDVPQTFVVKTEMDAYINERLRNQPQTIEDIKVKDIQDDPSEHILKLPKKIKDALDEKHLAPRWINKDKRMIDRALDIRGWTIFNRVLFPKVPKHFFTANGTVENGDSILGFMPLERAEILRKRPGQISQERIKDLPIERYKNSQGDEKIGYYKPAYTAEPDGQIEKGVGLYAQPDLPTQE